jgi:hypothetical protein
MIESIKLKQAGARWFHTRDHGGGLNLSKASLGEFVYEMLRRGCQIGSFFCLYNTYPRSWVGASVFMTEQMKDAIEKETRFRFQDPPRVDVN